MHAKETCTSMEYKKKTGDVIIDHCSRENIRYKHELVSLPDKGDHFNDLKTLIFFIRCRFISNGYFILTL